MGSVLSAPLEDDFKQSLSRKDLNSAVALLQQNRKLIDVRLSPKTGDKAFHVAVRSGDVEGLTRMINAIHASLAAPSHSHTSKDGPGHSMQDIKRKVAKAVNQINARGQTPLMLACEHGNVPIVTALLNAGADPWIGDDLVRRTCLHYAAGTGRDHSILTVIAFARTHPALRAAQRAPACLYEVHDIPAASGLTPLHYAAWRRQIPAVLVLTREGASLYARSGEAGLDPDCPTCNEGSTPLHLAALKGSHGTVKTLLKAYVLRISDDDEQQRQQLSQPSQPSQLQQQQGGHPQHPEGGAPDPRAVTDGLGNTPFSIARSNGHYHILSELNPLTPLAQVLAHDNPEDRALGVPRLQELAAKAAHVILMTQVTELAQQIKDSKLHVLPPTSLYAAVAAAPAIAKPSPGAASGLARVLSGHRSQEPSAHRSGSAHGAVLLEAASLLAGVLTPPAPGARAAQSARRHQSLHGGAGGTPGGSALERGSRQGALERSSRQGALERSSRQGALERPSTSSQRSVHGAAPPLRQTLSGAFSLRSAAALTAQLRQEYSRHRDSPGGPGGGGESSQHLQQLQEMQDWGNQDLEETSHMARTHRLLRGVGGVGGDEDGDEAPLALMAVVPSAGKTPASAILIDGRSSRAAGDAGAALPASAAPSRSSSLPRPSLRGSEELGSAAAAVARAHLLPAYPTFTPPRDASLLAAVDEDEATTPGSVPGAAAAAAASTPTGRRARAPSVAGHSPFSDAAAGADGPLISLFSMSRQSSQALGQVSLGPDEGPGPGSAASGSALVRLASFARQASQPVRLRHTTHTGGLVDEEPPAVGRRARVLSLPGHDSPRHSVGSAERTSPFAAEAGEDGSNGAELQQAGNGPATEAGPSGVEAGAGPEEPGGAGQGAGGLAALLKGQGPAPATPQPPPQQQQLQQQGRADALSDDGEVCGVCLDSGDFVELRQCGHTMCVDCATELIRLHQYKTALCPMCRGMICGFRLPVEGHH